MSLNFSLGFCSAALSETDFAAFIAASSYISSAASFSSVFFFSTLTFASFEPIPKKPFEVIDAENYRAKRQKTLEQLANRLAAKVVKTKKYVRLEPMNPYERKIIHATLQQNPDVSTRSEGEEPYRRVVIELKK